jgi:hypothetical protein
MRVLGEVMDLPHLGVAQGRVLGDRGDRVPAVAKPSGMFFAAGRYQASGYPSLSSAL